MKNIELIYKKIKELKVVEGDIPKGQRSGKLIHAAYIAGQLNMLIRIDEIFDPYVPRFWDKPNQSKKELIPISNTLASSKQNRTRDGLLMQARYLPPAQ